jgi:hypothetical protein
MTEITIRELPTEFASEFLKIWLLPKPSSRGVDNIKIHILESILLVFYISVSWDFVLKDGCKEFDSRC